jgi:hypothetical protein
VIGDIVGLFIIISVVASVATSYATYEKSVSLSEKRETRQGGNLLAAAGTALVKSPMSEAMPLTGAMTPSTKEVAPFSETCWVGIGKAIEDAKQSITTAKMVVFIITVSFAKGGEDRYKSKQIVREGINE